MTNQTSQQVVSTLKLAPSESGTKLYCSSNTFFNFPSPMELYQHGKNMSLISIFFFFVIRHTVHIWKCDLMLFLTYKI